ncbi:hypothetical protein R3P38DRAFT_256968 [Favolaschia claudopus]|uniref:Ribosomal protein S3 n=1 Tax=Favolaschia claudopus TaxID=2862362 RepID=A0AAW0CYG0_9AGAR
MRQGIWGEYSHARVKPVFPNLVSFPLATGIPFSLHVETDTKPLPTFDTPVDKHGKSLFPAPPALSSEVRRRFHRTAHIQVRGHDRTVDTDLNLKGSLGDAIQIAAVRQATDEPEWIPAPGPKDKKGLGMWRRAVRFESGVRIPFSPTTHTEIFQLGGKSSVQPSRIFRL